MKIENNKQMLFEMMQKLNPGMKIINEEGSHYDDEQRKYNPYGNEDDDEDTFLELVIENHLNEYEKINNLVDEHLNQVKVKEKEIFNLINNLIKNVMNSGKYVALSKNDIEELGIEIYEDLFHSQMSKEKKEYYIRWLLIDNF